MSTLPVSGTLTARVPEYSLPVNGSLVAAYYLSLAAAIQLMVTAVAGLQYGSQGLYSWDSVELPQLLGQDAVALIMAIPALFTAMWMTRRGSARGLVSWAGTLLYIAYWYHFYLAGIPFGPLYLIHIGTVASSLLALLVVVSRIDVERFGRRFEHSLPVRRLGGVMIGVSAAFFVAWISDILVQTMRGDGIDSVARSVYTVDLTLMLPATLAAGVMLWRRQPWGYVLAGPLLINAFGSLLTLFASTVLVAIWGEPFIVPLIVFPCAAAVLLLCVVRYLKALRV